MNRVLLIPSLVLLLFGALAFVASRDPAAKATAGSERPIVFATADDIKTLDVGKMSWMNDIRVAMGLWEGSVSYEPRTLEIVPGVAEKWEISPDGKTYTFHLRHDARWSNGDPVTARDFVFAWKRVLTPATGADYLTLFYPIVGAQAYAEALDKKQPADFAQVGIHAPDDRTVVVELSIPRNYFLSLFAFPPFFPLHEKSMARFLVRQNDPEQGYEPTWARAPALVTNGAFLLKDWQFKRYLLLERNPYYWDRANVKSRQIKVVAFQDSRTAFLAYTEGSVDALSFVPPDFGPELLEQQRAGKRRDIHYGPVFGSYYYIFDCTRPPVNDERVRKALALAIDKRQLVDQVTRMGQTPMDVLVPAKLIPGYTGPTGLPMDLPEARRLMAEAGYPGGRGFPTLDIMFNNEAAGHLQVAQAIGQMWRNNLGIEVNFRGLERGSFGTDRRTSNFTVARGGWYGDYTDPTTWLDLAKTGDGNNDGKFSSPAYDALLNQAAAQADPAKRLAILPDAERILVEDEFPFIPLYQYSDGYIYDDHKIENLYWNTRLMTEFQWLRRNDER